MRSLLVAFSLVLSLAALAQLSDETLLLDAYETDNPYATIETLKKIEAPERFADSLPAVYSLSYGIAYGKLAKVDTALLFLDQCLRRAEAGGYPYLLSRAGNAKGLVFFHAGRFEEAIQSYQQALSIAESPNYLEEIATPLGLSLIHI